MIVVKVYGGLAGQMLQYSLGRKLSILNNTTLYIDKSWYAQNTSSTYPRNFTLDKLNVKYLEVDKKSFKWKLYNTERLRFFNPFKLKPVNEKDFSKFDKDIFETGNNIILDGYWNSYKYFEDIKSTLYTELSPKELPDERNSQVLKHIKNSNSISVHFRRGDYTLTSFHGILSKEYYAKAIDLLKKDVPNPHLFVFSDEPEWVIANIDLKLPYTVVDFNRDEKNYWDIELMKNCKHNIIANSGFSWWAAWLNSHSNKQVVAPERWINSEKAQIDNIPEEWILI